MRLLPLDVFAHVFEPLLGHRVGLVLPRGNVGDALITAATVQLFAEFGVAWSMYDPDAPTEVDELVFGGGGNMGSLYRGNWDLRTRLLAAGPPLTILPQSFTSREDRAFHRVYVRERSSLAYCECGILAPDLALGLDHENAVAPMARTGIFLRKDCETALSRPWLTKDPAKICRTPRQYLALAARFEQIITDRLHFAICGLIVGRDTTLLPNSYHKNRSMYETWLQALGCHFAESLAEARAALRCRRTAGRAAVRRRSAA